MTWEGARPVIVPIKGASLAYNSLFRQRNSSWKPSSSTPSPTPSPIFPRARVNCGGIFDFDVKAERLGAVSKELEDPKIWDDPQRAQELSRERKQLESVVESLTKLHSELADSTELFGMARSEGDDATVASVQADVAKIAKVVDDLEFRRMFNQPLDPPTASSTSRPAAAAPRRRTGHRC